VLAVSIARNVGAGVMTEIGALVVVWLATAVVRLLVLSRATR
jgi:hypothetical protein